MCLSSAEESVYWSDGHLRFTVHVLVRVLGSTYQFYTEYSNCTTSRVQYVLASKYLVSYRLYTENRNGTWYEHKCRVQ
jgi:hypothetical protein